MYNLKPSKALLIFIFLLAGCGSDKSLNNEHDKESEMFFKEKKENYVIFSPLEGVLMRDGKPLPNTKIIRTLWWNSNQDGLIEEFFTDGQGHFSLPIHEEQLSLGLSQFVSSALLRVDLDNQLYDIWYNNKFDELIFAETDGKIEGLICDLATEEIGVTADLSKIMTICRWKNMPASDL